MSTPPRRAMTPQQARTLSQAHLAVWCLVAGSIVLLMCRSGGPNNLGGLAFLGIIFAFLGGLGVVGALRGLQHAHRAQAALAHGDSERSAREVRAAVLTNAIAGVLQLALFVVSFFMLTKLHH